MSALQHTAGPWSVAKGSDQFVCSDGFWIASTMGVRGEEGAANARLMAAAPDMLAALEGVLPGNVSLVNEQWADSMVVPLDVTLGELRAVRAAIAKARGQ